MRFLVEASLQKFTEYMSSNCPAKVRRALPFWHRQWGKGKGGTWVRLLTPRLPDSPRFSPPIFHGS